MKRILLLTFCLTSCAASLPLEDEGIVISPRERVALIKKLLDMQEEIDTLEKKLQTLKEKTGCV